MDIDNCLSPPFQKNEKLLAVHNWLMCNLELIGKLKRVWNLAAVLQVIYSKYF